MKRGIIFLDLLVAIFILSLIIFFTVPPAIDYFEVQSLNSSTKKIYIEILALRNKALVSNTAQVIRVSEKFAGYFINSNFQKLNKNVKFGFFKSIYGPPASPTSLVNKACTFKNSEIHIGTDGQINSGTIYMVDKKYKHMYAITVGVAQKVYIRRYAYKNGGWILLD